MRNVLRDESTGEITHIHYDVYYGHNRFFTKRDYETLVSHEITKEEILDWTGEDLAENMTTNVLDVLNDEYSVKQFRYDVISYVGLLKDEEKLIKL